MSLSHHEQLSKKDSNKLLDLKRLHDALPAQAAAPAPVSAAPTPVEAAKWKAWILKNRGARVQPNAKLRLFCFPHAGSGSYIFHGWEKELPISVEVMPVEYPGRNTRRKEPNPNDMNELVTALVDALLPLFREKPFAFLGHSMGSWVIYATTQELQRRGGPLPVHLFASGNTCPTEPEVWSDEDPEWTRGVKIANLPPAEFWKHWFARNGQSELLSDPFVQEMAYPVLSADMRIIESYGEGRGVMDPNLKLPCTLTVMVSDGDRISKEEVAAWGNVCEEGKFEDKWFPGDHFYIVDDDSPGRKPAMEFLMARLKEVVADLAKV